MRTIIKNLLSDKGNLSLTRLIAITAWLAFLIVSGYLVITGKEWIHYEVFATFTAGGGAIVRISDKFIGKKYNNGKEEEL